MHWLDRILFGIIVVALLATMIGAVVSFVGQ